MTQVVNGGGIFVPQRTNNQLIDTMKKNPANVEPMEVSFENRTMDRYEKIRERFDDEVFFRSCRKAFFQAHPECPRPKPIERLDLVMKKEYAKEILSGTKKVEIRAFSEFYSSRLYDKKVLAFEDEHWDDEPLRTMMLDFNDSVRAVKTIHFHDYGKTWFLDVECPENNTVVLVDDQVKYLQEQYGFHEFDEQLADLDAAEAPERPIFFYFAIGKILGTDL